MTKVIYKYRVPIEDDFSLELPKNGKILRLNYQVESSLKGKVPVLWVLLNPNLEIEKREFKLFKLNDKKFFKIDIPKNFNIIGLFFYEGIFLLGEIEREMDTKSLKTRYFRLISTGEDIHHDILNYIDSVIIEEIKLIYHLIEIRKYDYEQSLNK